jgi:hypothetical protein
MPRLAYGLAMRARRPRPSEKTPSASSPTFPRTAIHAGLAPRGGAGSARPPLRENRLSRHLRVFPARPSLPWLAPPRRGGLRTPARKALGLDRGMSPFRPPGVRSPIGEMECLGMRPALPCGRGDRVPPRKSPFASSPAFPRKAIPARMAPPRRGGLRTPANVYSPRERPGKKAIYPQGQLRTWKGWIKLAERKGTG